MKKTLVLILNIVLCITLIGCKDSKNESLQQKEREDIANSIPFEALSRDDIEKISVSINSQEMNATLSDDEIVQFIEIVNQLEIYEKVEPQTLVGQMIHFDIEKVDESTIELGIITPYVIIDDIWYEGENEICDRLNQFANDFVK